MEWWHTRSDHEKRNLMISGIVAVILLSYLLVIKPFNASLRERQQQVQYQSQLLQQIRPQVAKVQSLRQHLGEVKTISTAELLTVISTSLQSAHLDAYANSIKQNESNQVQVEFQQVPFDKLTDYLENLWQRYEIHTQSFTAIPLANQSGLVKAQIILTL